MFKLWCEPGIRSSQIYHGNATERNCVVTKKNMYLFRLSYIFKVKESWRKNVDKKFSTHSSYCTLNLTPQFTYSPKTAFQNKDTNCCWFACLKI